MIDDLSSISEEERCLFRPFTRESLTIIEGRIAEEVRRFKELERKRAEGDAVSIPQTNQKLSVTNTHISKPFHMSWSSHPSTQKETTLFLRLL